MKNFNEFINESNQKDTEDIGKILWEQYGAIQMFDRFLRIELGKQKFGSLNIRHDDYQSKIVNGNVNIAFTIELGTRVLESTELDIPDYFMGLKEFFIPYGYIKTIKGDSTAYYNIMVDYNKLLESEMFWKNILDMSIVVKKQMKRPFEDHEKVNYPDWFMKKYQSYFDSANSIEKFDL